jgi:glucuronoarabinoxylan endo-1,4-beta-xylanase
MKKLVFLLLCIFTCICGIASAQTATINWTYQHQIIDGFGGSDEAWSSSMSTANQNFFFGTGNGQLGLSILRVGLTDGNQDPGDCTSVSTSCAGAVVGDMQAAIANGGRIYATPWSPPAAYKTNGSTTCSGGSGGGALASGSYGSYATWMANFVKSLQTEYNISLYAVSIQNEPNICPSYDGALWSGANLDTFITSNLGPTFSANEISTLIFQPEVSDYFDLPSYSTCGTDPSCTNYVGGYNFHDYDGGISGYTAYADPYPSGWTSGKKYWETEASCGNGYGPNFCPGGFNTGIASALDWGMLIDQRIAVDNANAWLYWQLIDYNQAGGAGTSTDGSLMANAASGYTITDRAYVLGQYAKFVRPGYYRIDATHTPQNGVSVSAYQNTSSSTLVIIATNYTSSSVSQTFDISNAPTFTSLTPTITSGSQSIATLSSVGVSGNSFTYTLPAQSIITFVGTSSGGQDYTLTVGTNGTGSGTVSGTDCSSGSYASGTAIGACTANPNSGSTFAGWSASGSTSCSGTGSCPQFDLIENTNLTATFNSSNISLTVNKAGSGSGTVSGTDCSTGSYASGTEIGACTANPGSGSTFAGWSASGSSSCSGTGSCAQFSLTSTTTLTATFNTTGGGGTPTYVQAVAAPGAYTTNPSTSITITPTAGDTLTVWAVGSALTGFNTPTASGLTFTLQGSSIASGNDQAVWTATVPTTQSYTISISTSSSSTSCLSAIAVETSGTTTSGIVLSPFGVASCGSSCTGSSLTTTSANSMVLTFMWYGVGETESSPSPFAFTSVNGDDSPGMYNGAGYYLKSSAGSYTPTWHSTSTPAMPNVSVALAASSGSTVTGVSVSCSPTSITTSQTSQCSATVTGTGSPSQAVTWSVSSGSGSLNSSGLFTPSGTGTSTIKATSVQNSSYSGTANVTVTSSGTPGYVQAVAAPGAYSSNPSTTIHITSTAGDTLTLWEASESTITSFNAPAASGLTFTSQGTSVASGQAQGIWTAPVTSTGSYTITLSANASSTVTFEGVVVETSNTTTSGIVLSSFGTTSGCPSCSGSTLTTTSANSMVLTFMGYGIGLTGSSPSPFAFTSVNGNDSTGMYNGAGYYLKSSTGLYSPKWTSSSSPAMPNVSVALAP